MKTITVNGRDYKLEYSFMAAEHKDTVQKMFNALNGSYLVKRANTVKETGSEEAIAEAMLDGTSEMVADIPHIVKTAFYSGLLEHENVSEDNAYEIMKQYMKENKISFRKLFEDIKTCMEDDGFFDLSGLTEMMQAMDKAVEEHMKKIPQDHKRKSTGTR